MCSLKNKTNAQIIPWGVADSLQKILDDCVINNNSPGGIMIVHSRSDNWTWKGQSGIANISTMQQADTSMFYRIGSISKNIMAVTILHLVDNSILSIHDTIGKWLDTTLTNKIAYSEHITLKHLLNHTSGIFSYTDDFNLMNSLLTDPNASFTSDSLISIALSHPPDFFPGDSMKYNNTGYVILTKIIESACGMSYYQYATQNILNPTGLNNTFFPDTNVIFQNHMRCYADFDFNSILEDYTQVSPTFAIGAGEIISTLDNQIHYFNTLIDGNIISQSSYNELLSPHPGSEYSLGTTIIPGLIMGHAGNYFNTSGLWYFETLDVVIAFNFNLNLVDFNNGILIPVYLLLSKPDLSVQNYNTNNDLIHIYPNPADEELTIEINEPSEITITDMNGQIVWNTHASQLVSSYEISMLPAGVYNFIAVNSKGIASKKLIKL